MFTFHKQLDSFGYDLYHVPDKTIEELKQICLQNDRCVAFNSLGYMKYYLTPQETFKKIPQFTKNTDGLYIYEERWNNISNREPVLFDGYTFYPNKDSPGNDIFVNVSLPIGQMKELADQNPNCVAFNTIGFFKDKVVSEKEFITIRPEIKNEGLYLKNTLQKSKIKVKFTCNWCDCERLKEEWGIMSKTGNNKPEWNNIEMTTTQYADFYVIINKPWPGEYYDPIRTIVFQMEPWCGNPTQKWGVKTWGEWARPDPGKFLQVRSHDKYVNNCLWQFSLTYSQLKDSDYSYRKTKGNRISSICSSKYFDPGHIKRIDFIKYIEAQNDPDVQIDIYNHNNDHGFRGYQGPHPSGQKEVGMVNYKYYFMGENNAEHNFITEKIWEPLITETLCFYWGCPNIADHIDPRAYIVLNLDDLPEAFETVKRAIIDDEWGKRIDIIRKEKQRVLDYYNVFPTLERVLEKEMSLTSGMTNDEILYRKYFSLGEKLKTVCFFHNCFLDKGREIFNEYLERFQTSGLTNIVDKIFIVNLGSELEHDPSTEMNIINYSPNANLYELPTLNLIRVFSRFNPDAKILYLHSKGVTHNDEMLSKVKDWADYMMYFLVDHSQICLDLLDNYDTVGCNLLDSPKKHYSGNFWWANARHLQNLPRVEGDRHQAEWWVCSSGNNYCIHSSGVNHYHDRYPKEMYADHLKDSIYAFNQKTRIKCINLERRPDRKQKVEQLLRDHQLLEYCDFFGAIDGKRLQPTQEIKDLFRGNDFQNRSSFIGCALSHYTLWKQLLEDQYEHYLILEDDISFADRNIVMGINRVFEMANDLGEWDIIYLGHHIRQNALAPYQKKFSSQKTLTLIRHLSNITIGGIFGYLLSKSGAKKFLDYISVNGIKHGIDYVMFKFEKEMQLKNYEVVPRLILSDFVDYHNSVDSDIQYDVNSLW